MHESSSCTTVSSKLGIDSFFHFSHCNMSVVVSKGYLICISVRYEVRRLLIFKIKYAYLVLNIHLDIFGYIFSDMPDQIFEHFIF